jgi:hypothetical protein
LKPDEGSQTRDIRARDHGLFLKDSDFQEVAEFLCRSGTPLDVAAKAKEELGLTWQAGGMPRKRRN